METDYGNCPNCTHPLSDTNCPKCYIRPTWCSCGSKTLYGDFCYLCEQSKVDKCEYCNVQKERNHNRYCSDDCKVKRSLKQCLINGNLLLKWLRKPYEEPEDPSISSGFENGFTEWQNISFDFPVVDLSENSGIDVDIINKILFPKFDTINDSLRLANSDVWVFENPTLSFVMYKQLHVTLFKYI